MVGRGTPPQHAGAVHADAIDDDGDGGDDDDDDDVDGDDDGAGYDLKAFSELHRIQTTLV